jgi:hypothetical protein
MPESIAAVNYGDRVVYFAILMNVLFLLLIVNLVRKRQLSERFALAWLVIPIILLVFFSSRHLLEQLASLVGIYYAPAIMIPIIFGLFILVSLYFSVKVSKAENRIKSLSQELALLRHKVEKSN